MIDQTPQSAHRAAEEYAQQAPPVYGEHLFDQLYSEVDPSGYRTPGPTSGPGTPFGSLSRNISAENLASMNALTDTDISASALHSRLARLHAGWAPHPPSPGEQNDSRSDARLSVHPDYFTHSGSSSHTPTSPTLSRRPSDELDHEHIPSGMATPFHPQYAEVETLSRVPSYSTAVRTTVKPRDADLPDYNAVVAEISTPPPPQSPQQAHIRSGRRSPTSHFSPMEVHQRFGLFNSHNPHKSADDEERRLRLLQARARS